MDPLTLSLDEVIKMKKREIRYNKQALESLSLEEIVRKMKKNAISSRMPAPPRVTRSDNVNKSLDEIIREKQICKTQNVSSVPPVQVKLMSPSTSSSEVVAPRRKIGVTKISLRPLDPHTTSLDDMIEKVEPIPGISKSLPKTTRTAKRKLAADGVVELDLDPKLKFPGNQRQYPNVTPYRAVGFLNKQGMIIEIKTGKHDVPDYGDRSHMWRCVVTCGGIKGIADSVRKVVAREMACEQFLVNLRQMYEGCAIPKYGTLPELFIDPRIFTKLEDAANQLGRLVAYEIRLKPAKTSCDSDSSRQSYYTFVCQYLVGTDEFEGENYVIEYAKLIAARNAYIALTGKSVQPTQYFVGASCEIDLGHEFNEVEVFQTVSRNEVQY